MILILSVVALTCMVLGCPAAMLALATCATSVVTLLLVDYICLAAWSAISTSQQPCTYNVLTSNPITLPRKQNHHPDKDLLHARPDGQDTLQSVQSELEAVLQSTTSGAEKTDAVHDEILQVDYLCSGSSHDIFVVKFCPNSVTSQESCNDLPLIPDQLIVRQRQLEGIEANSNEIIQVRNEVGVRKFLAEHFGEKVPTPHIYAWNDGSSGDAPYIIEEFVQGVPMHVLWDDEHSSAERDAVVTQLAKVLAQLATVRFSLIGGFDPKTYGPATLSEPCMLAMGRGHLRDPSVYDIGPYRNSKEYILAMFDKEIATLTLFGEEELSLVGWDDQYTEKWGTPEQFVSHLREVRESISDMTDVDHEQTFTICHGDLAGRNIIFNQDSGKITILDWEYAAILPPCEFFTSAAAQTRDVFDFSCRKHSANGSGPLLLLENEKRTEQLKALMTAEALKLGLEKDEVSMITSNEPDDFIEAVRVTMMPDNSPCYAETIQEMRAADSLQVDDTTSSEERMDEAELDAPDAEHYDRFEGMNSGIVNDECIDQGDGDSNDDRCEGLHDEIFNEECIDRDSNDWHTQHDNSAGSSSDDSNSDSDLSEVFSDDDREGDSRSDEEAGELVKTDVPLEYSGADPISQDDSSLASETPPIEPHSAKLTSRKPHKLQITSMDDHDAVDDEDDSTAHMKTGTCAEEDAHETRDMPQTRKDEICSKPPDKEQPLRNLANASPTTEADLRPSDLSKADRLDGTIPDALINEKEIKQPVRAGTCPSAKVSRNDVKDVSMAANNNPQTYDACHILQALQNELVSSIEDDNAEWTTQQSRKTRKKSTKKRGRWESANTTESDTYATRAPLKPAKRTVDLSCSNRFQRLNRNESLE